MNTEHKSTARSWVVHNGHGQSFQDIHSSIFTSTFTLQLLYATYGFSYSTLPNCAELVLYCHRKGRVW